MVAAQQAAARGFVGSGTQWGAKGLGFSVKDPPTACLPAGAPPHTIY
jgi:hypothetical protein